MNEIEQQLSKARQGAFSQESSDAAQRLALLAERGGLIDVAYAMVDSPLGPLMAAATSKGLVRLSYQAEPLDSLLANLAARLSPRVLESPSRLDDARRQLDEYFDGRRRTFELPIDWALTRGFGRKVLRATARVPFGRVASYGEIAGKAGSPKASRAAGNALGANPIPIVVPCHRIIRTGGGLGGYTGGIDKKQFLLRIEGFL